jgi:hypothetical protein
MSWVVDQEKLLAHIVLDDRYARILSPGAGDAFFRAFIVEDRTTHKITLKFRFTYRDGKRSWSQLTPTDQGQDVVAKLRDGVVYMLESGAAIKGTPLPKGAVKVFNPPDDHGDGSNTVKWLADQDLIEIRSVEGALDFRN